MRLHLSLLWLAPCCLQLLWAQGRPEAIDTLVVPEATDEIPGGEDVLDQIQTEVEDTELMDRLLWLKEHPFDLNTVSEEELMTIPAVTSSDARAIIALRKAVKRFNTVGQLALIEGSGEIILKKVTPYVIVKGSEGNFHQPLVMTLRSRTTKDLQTRRGYLDNSFLGSPLKSYSRISLVGPDLEAGALWEKDAAERVSDGFVSGYARVGNLSFVSSGIVGDYVVEAGQGLVLWRGTAFAKGSKAVSIAQRSALGIQPYRSADEFNFQRGIAASSVVTTGLGEISVSTFFSRRSLGGTVAGPDTVSSLYEEGLFRTESEQKKKGAVNERMIGGLVRLKGVGGWSVGASYYRATFDKVIGQGLDFVGKETSVGGVDANAQLGTVSVFGEAAHTGKHAFAGNVGGVLALGIRTSVGFVYRDYSPRFINLHARGFGESDGTNNERGTYIGVETTLLHGFTLAGYFDQFKFPSSTFSSPLPTQGHEVLAQVDGPAAPRLDLTARFTTKTVENVESVVDLYNRTSHAIVERSQQKERLTITYRVSRRLRVKGRVELTQVNYTLLNRSEEGNLFYQEIQWKPAEALALEARLILFDTDSYDSRLYEYENDLRGVFANPALYGKGRRWYLLVGYTLDHLIRISAKYSETQKDGVKSIGSGLTEIHGDLDNRISIQVDMKF